MNCMDRKVCMIAARRRGSAQRLPGKATAMRPEGVGPGKPEGAKK
jgi:hypothetical protein